MGYFNNEDVIGKWVLQRHSRFTSSENFKLLSTATGKMFGAGAWTYIEQKALELTTDVWDMPKLEEVESLLHGKVYEFPAYEAVVKETGLHNLEYFGSENPIFIKYPKMEAESGGTPDAALSINGEIKIGGEFKCPKNPVYHFRRLDWKDQYDLRDDYILAYTQCQHLMMCTGAELWLFGSYDERQRMKSKKLKLIEVLPDKKFQDNLEIRLMQAVKEKYALISSRYQSEVRNRAEFDELVGSKF